MGFQPCHCWTMTSKRLPKGTFNILRIKTNHWTMKNIESSWRCVRHWTSAKLSWSLILDLTDIGRLLLSTRLHCRRTDGLLFPGWRSNFIVQLWIHCTSSDKSDWADWLFSFAQIPIAQLIFASCTYYDWLSSKLLFVNDCYDSYVIVDKIVTIKGPC